MSVCTCVRCGHPSQVLGTSAADQLASESTHPARAYRLRNSTAAITPEAAAKLIAFLNAPENLELWQIKTVTDGVAGLIKVKPPMRYQLPPACGLWWCGNPHSRMKVRATRLRAPANANAASRLPSLTVAQSRSTCTPCPCSVPALALHTAAHPWTAC